MTPTAIAKCIKKAGRAVYTSIEEYYRNKHNAPPPKKELVMYGIHVEQHSGSKAIVCLLLADALDLVAPQPVGRPTS